MTLAAKQRMSKKPSSSISGWKVLRIIVATLVMMGFLLALTDFRNDIPESIGHFLAQLQFVPSVQSVAAGVVIPSLFILIGLVFWNSSFRENLLLIPLPYGDFSRYSHLVLEKN